jgi:hypothetical protein
MRLESFDQWWHWIALALAIAAALSYLVFWWRRDTAELPRPLRWTLLVLRSAAWLGVLLFFLDLQKRSEEEIQKPSRVAVLVDTSLSMSLPADWSTGGEGFHRSTSNTKSPSTGSMNPRNLYQSLFFPATTRTAANSLQAVWKTLLLFGKLLPGPHGSVRF